MTDSQEVRLVIAIDYGTTYTGIVYQQKAVSRAYWNCKIGIAFATTTGNSAYLHDIDTINISGDEMSNDEKIPSVMLYPPASNL